MGQGSQYPFGMVLEVAVDGDWLPCRVGKGTINGFSPLGTLLRGVTLLQDNQWR